MWIRIRDLGSCQTRDGKRRIRDNIPYLRHWILVLYEEHYGCRLQIRAAGLVQIFEPKKNVFQFYFKKLFRGLREWSDV
jgi:hypothetical protein